MSRIIKPLVVFILLAGNLLSAITQAAPRAVDANNGVVLKLQGLVKDITTERDLLKTEKDKLVIDIEKLKKDNAASASESDRLSGEVSAQKSSNDAVRGTLEQTHAKLLEVIEKYNALNQAKNDLGATHVILQNSHKQIEAELQSCEGKNIKLFEAGKDVLNSYENIGVMDTLFKSEPVLQFKSVEMQALAQEYEDKLRKQKYQHKELTTTNVITPVTKETKQP